MAGCPVVGRPAFKDSNRRLRMYRLIVVPLDGSPLSEDALPVARDLARRSGATLHLVHVYVPEIPPRIDTYGRPLIDDSLQSLGKAHALAHLRRVRERLQT